MIHSIIPNDYIMEGSIPPSPNEKERRVTPLNRMNGGPALYQLHSANLWENIDVLDTRETSWGF